MSWVMMVNWCGGGKIEGVHDEEGFMDMHERIKLTRTIWIVMMVGIIAASTFTISRLGPAVLGLVFLMVVPTIVVTGFIWQWGAPFANQGMSSSNQEETEKAKRDRIEAVLRRLSDTQLQTLRERITSGELSDEDLSDMLEDEGRYKQKRY